MDGAFQKRTKQRGEPQGWSSSRAKVACEICQQTYDRDPALEVACPVASCQARVGAWCKNPSGHKAMHIHRQRMQRALDDGFEMPCPGPPAAPGAPAQASPPPVDPWLARAALGP